MADFVIRRHQQESPEVRVGLQLRFRNLRRQPLQFGPGLADIGDRPCQVQVRIPGQMLGVPFVDWLLGLLGRGFTLQEVAEHGVAFLLPVAYVNQRLQGGPAFAGPDGHKFGRRLRQFGQGQGTDGPGAVHNRSDLLEQGKHLRNG
jgi:hypothetical protein